MSSLMPSFDAHRIFVEPWTTEFALYGWLTLMGFLVAGSCGLVGNFLILRRMALVGDAISHSVLPGIAVAFLIAKNRGSLAMVLGAVTAALVTTALIELVHKRSRVKQDAAIGIAFSSLFALGVVLIAVYADKVDLDQDCVLNGELALIPLLDPVVLGGVALGPAPVVRMGTVLVLTGGLVALFYKELLVSSFDEGLARALGIRAGWLHHALMAWLAIVVVCSFEAVGAILVIAMLILPGATAALLFRRLPARLLASLVHAALSAVAGMHLAVWLVCSPAAAMVVAACGWFVLAWAVSPFDGLRLLFHRPSAEPVPAAV
jgi:manganese/zinc/iron transport system permease protein